MIIGFDLDQTLYPKSPDIDKAVQQHIYEEIAKDKKCSLADATKLFIDLYKTIGSGSAVLKQLGFSEEKARTIIQTALDTADITPFLKPNKEVIKLLYDIKQKYTHITLITGSNKDLTHEKLKLLEIPEEIFELIITGETSKSDGTAYKKWLEHYKMPPEQFTYIGDRKTVDSDVPSSLGINTILVNVQKKDPEIKIPQLMNVLDVRQILLGENNA